MAAIDNLLKALDERELAQRVGLKHDEARMSYQLQSNTVADFDAFTDTIADYYNHHFTRCVSGGGTLSRSEAAGRAKKVLEDDYRRRREDLMKAFNDAHDGTEGGMRAVLDKLAEGLKAESVGNYIGEMFDRHVAPNSWEDKVAIIRQFIAQHGASLGSSIDAGQPERYAQNYKELIEAYVEAMRRASPVFRRL